MSLKRCIAWCRGGKSAVDRGESKHTSASQPRPWSAVAAACCRAAISAASKPLPPASTPDSKSDCNIPVGEEGSACCKSRASSATCSASATALMLYEGHKW